MSERWALHLVGEERQLAARLRTEPAVEVRAVGEEVWLRGPQSDERLLRQLRLMPAGLRYDVLADGQLRRPLALVPVGQLPTDNWQPLAEWFGVQLPVAQLPAQSVCQAALTLVRDEQERQPNLLLTTLQTWAAYATTAPQVRLDQWWFSVSERQQVVVRGQPLPPLPGEQYTELEGLATPAGWRWSPAVEAQVLRELLRMQSHDLALLRHDGTWELVASTDFVKATRSAVRQTLAGASL